MRTSNVLFSCVEDLISDALAGSPEEGPYSMTDAQGSRGGGAAGFTGASSTLGIVHHGSNQPQLSQGLSKRTLRAKIVAQGPEVETLREEECRLRWGPLTGTTGQ